MKMTQNAAKKVSKIDDYLSRLRFIIDLNQPRFFPQIFHFFFLLFTRILEDVIILQDLMPKG